jgi:hypothetical protein
MFDLSETDLGARILGCGDGPAAFNAEATRRGARVTSVDPLYAFTRSEIRERIDASYEDMLEQTRQNAGEFAWDTIGSVEELGRLRLEAMEAFLDDYDRGLDEDRYVSGELPNLPFKDQAFDLALCGHFLFLYSTRLDLEFHLASIQELTRVASEVRVFPLLALGGDQSPFVPQCVAELSGSGFDVTIDLVPYEFQLGGNRMMRVRRAHGVAARHDRDQEV